MAHAIHYAEPKHLEHAATILGMVMTELGSDSIQSTTAYSEPAETDGPTTTLSQCLARAGVTLRSPR